MAASEGRDNGCRYGGAMAANEPLPLPRQAARECVSRLVQMVVELEMTEGGPHGLPRRREADLAGLAALTLDPVGLVVSWSVTAPTAWRSGSALEEGFERVEL